MEWVCVVKEIPNVARPQSQKELFMNKNIVVTSLSSLCFSASLLSSTNALAANYIVSEFTASYHLEDDGHQPGQGNDGTDPNIIPNLVATEVSPYAGINYSWSNLFGINAYNFYGAWEGEIEVFDSTAVITANFDVSNSDISFYVNDELYGKWKNSNDGKTLTLEPGTHSIRIEHRNHWHTAGFNVSFTDYPKLSTSLVAEYGDLSAMVGEDTRLVYLAAYESGGLYNDTVINIPEYDGDIMLFLSSYAAMNWEINNPYNTDISTVVVNSYAQGSSVNSAEDLPIYEVMDLRRAYSDLSQGGADVYEMTDHYPDYSYGAYRLTTVDIPEFE